MLYQNNRLNLAPSATEYNIGLYYNLPLDGRSSVNFDSLLRMNPQHTATDSDATFFAKYMLEF
jgi:hypothetical protein